MYKYDKKLVKNAQVLRKCMTKEERKLWFQFLKRLPVTVHRQHNIGEYIVDFYIAKYKTVIEIDGLQHGEEKHAQADKKRDETLSRLGIRVLRYTNKDVNEIFNAVAEDILKRLGLSVEDLKEK